MYKIKRILFLKPISVLVLTFIRSKKCKSTSVI